MYYLYVVCIYKVQVIYLFLFLFYGKCGGIMKRNIAYKFRIYPDRIQRELISKTFGCVRFVYNRMLEDRILYYEKTGLSLLNTPAPYKKEYEWLREVDSLALANAQMNLNTAFKNFYSNRNIGYPKYKSKKNHHYSYTTNMVNNNIRIIGNTIILPKLKSVKIKKHRNIPDHYRLKSVTVSMTPSHKYYVSILFEYEEDIALNTGSNYLGLDYAMDGLYVASDKTNASYPKYYRHSLDKLKKEQRKLSKMIKGSHNYRKQRIRLSKIHEKITNQRKDFLHKLSCQIANEYDGVCIEDLNMKSMSQCLNFGKSVHDNGYGMFIRMLSYKLESKGKKLIKIDKMYPSSKRCSYCGNVRHDLKLSDRLYICPKCRTVIDRDYNASLNILQEGLRLASISN